MAKKKAKKKVQEVDLDKFYLISSDVWVDVEGLKCATSRGAIKNLKQLIKETEQENEACGEKDAPVPDYRIYKVKLVY